MVYPLLRNLLFRFDAEAVHYFSMNLLRSVCATAAGRALIRNSFAYKEDDLSQTIFGLPFRNPVGMGAGFDKNARFLRELDAIGFGFVEIGTVTPKPQAGNDKPRLFRLPHDKAIINRMGFNNDGLEAIRQRLINWNNRPSGSRARMIVGGNIGKNKVTPNEDAWKDYVTCFNGLFEHVDYFVVNVSSPNTPGLRELQEKDALYRILSELQSLNQGKNKPLPLLLKIAPDLTDGQLDDIADLAQQVQLSGLVAANTTISRAGLTPVSAQASNRIGMGGLSGKPLRERATEVVSYLAKQTGGRTPIVASGGIFTGADAREKLAAGASLVQVWTGFIYEGPAIVQNICRSLAADGAGFVKQS